VSDFLDTKRKEIAGRLRELEPLIAEYRQLEAAQTALAGLPGRARTATRRTRTTRAAARPAAPRRRGRVLPGLERDSKIAKRGRGWFPS